MRLYTDLLTGDELFSDSYPMKLVDDLYWEVEGKSIVEKIDIDESKIGGNKAQGGGEDGEPVEDDSVDPSAITGINIVIAHRLQQTSFDKKSYMAYIKDYMKALLEKLQVSKPVSSASCVSALVRSVLICYPTGACCHLQVWHECCCQEADRGHWQGRLQLLHIGTYESASLICCWSDSHCRSQ